MWKVYWARLISWTILTNIHFLTLQWEWLMDEKMQNSKFCSRDETNIRSVIQSQGTSMKYNIIAEAIRIVKRAEMLIYMLKSSHLTFWLVIYLICLTQITNPMSSTLGWIKSPNLWNMTARIKIKMFKLRGLGTPKLSSGTTRLFRFIFSVHEIN